jgi:hypothetical protein
VCLQRDSALLCSLTTVRSLRSHSACDNRGAACTRGAQWPIHTHLPDTNAVDVQCENGDKSDGGDEDQPHCPCQHKARPARASARGRHTGKGCTLGTGSTPVAPIRGARLVPAPRFAHYTGWLVGIVIVGWHTYSLRTPTKKATHDRLPSTAVRLRKTVLAVGQPHSRVVPFCERTQEESRLQAPFKQGEAGLDEANLGKSGPSRRSRSGLGSGSHC